MFCIHPTLFSTQNQLKFLFITHFYCLAISEAHNANHCKGKQSLSAYCEWPHLPSSLLCGRSYFWRAYVTVGMKSMVVGGV